jgi:hypothetical protein
VVEYVAQLYIKERAIWRRDDVVGVAIELPAGRSRTLVPVGTRRNLFFETSKVILASTQPLILSL